MPGTIWERLRRQDKGTLLVEATVCLGIAGVLGLGVTNAQLQANQTQRNSSNFNIVAQYTQGALEKAKATPWSELGTVASKSPAGDSMLPAGMTSVRDGKLIPSTVDTVRKLKVTTLVTVGWLKKPVGTSPYGTKLVIVKTTWQDREGDSSTSYSHTEQSTITPGVGEAPPASIRGNEGGAAAVTPPPVAPAPSPTYSAPPVPTSTPAPDSVASPTPAPTSNPAPPAVKSPIDVKYSEVGSSYNLGSASGSETGGLPRGGRYRNYTNGQIIWQPDIGAVALRKTSASGFTARFNAEDGVTGRFGYPLADEETLSSTQRTQYFENGQLLWKQGLGDAWLANGTSRNFWLKHGGVSGWVGFPTSELKTGLRSGGTSQTFENATLYWSLDTGPSLLNGAILGKYAELGGVNSAMGYPIGVEYTWKNQTRRDFQNGYMLWTAANGVSVH